MDRNFNIMIYLKTYENWNNIYQNESVDLSAKYNISIAALRDVNDIFLELKDDGCDVEVSIKSINSMADSINVLIRPEESITGIGKNYIEYIERLNDYMNSINEFDEPDIWISYININTSVTTNISVINSDILFEYLEEHIINSVKLTFTMI